MGFGTGIQFIAGVQIEITGNHAFIAGENAMTCCVISISGDWLIERSSGRLIDWLINGHEHQMFFRPALFFLYYSLYWIIERCILHRNQHFVRKHCDNGQMVHLFMDNGSFNGAPRSVLSSNSCFSFSFPALNISWKPLVRAIYKLLQRLVLYMHDSSALRIVELCRSATMIFRDYSKKDCRKIRLCDW